MKFRSYIRIAFIWSAVLFAYVYFGQVVRPNMDERNALILKVIQGDVKADYLYAMFTVATAQHWLLLRFGHPALWHALIDCGGILFLFACAYRYLESEFRSSLATLVGLLWLVITMPLFFRHHYYHPTDFWGVGLMFGILSSARAERTVRLAGLLFVSGAIWEKALYVPLILFLYFATQHGWAKSLRLTALPASAVLFWFIAWRLAFPEAPRVLLRTWTQFLHNLPYDAFKWTLWLGPLVIPAVGLWRNSRDGSLFWLLWLLYIPLLVLTLIILTRFWGELRTFWILQPIAISVVAAWATQLQKNTFGAVHQP
jgi:hypothetical protein